ncbi:sporulation protein Cse60 [Ectobacillus antri]|uniref:Sporulation protein Cse60 n=1 Tax=Ectobacillus antri TaxID=2486280 RepID=A0ABT6H468_9BACI|nr:MULTISPECIES: sporulation protein Cse60 [Ectobacillus]MDG4656464.1 sporulation protein Cse60 [Ectobacillus antri]MDG5753514.1 sporulation protein Cse60 [Ectobacillus antri]UOY94351.1 sporulation protein Cse60 [Ectobacillus sp. JY-23]
MRVKIFDEMHEKDLEERVNAFLKKIDDTQIVDVKYQVAIANNNDENQIYCFSAMIIYRA